MVGTAIGLAVLGTDYAMTEGGGHGPRVPMLLGGLVQVISGAVVWRATRLSAEGAGC